MSDPEPTQKQQQAAAAEYEKFYPTKPARMSDEDEAKYQRYYASQETR